MSFLSLILTCIGVFIATTTAISTATRFQMRHRDFCPVESATAGVLAFTTFLLVLIATAPHNIWFSVSLLALSILILFAETLSHKAMQYGLQYMTCLLGTYMLFGNGSLFQQTSLMTSAPIVALVWLTVTRITIQIDKIPQLSLLFIMSIGIFFSVLGISNLLPRTIMYISMIMTVSCIAAIGTVRHWTQKACLGRFAATFIGFAYGGCFCYFMSNGFSVIPLIALSYYVLEWLIAVLGGMWVARSFSGQPISTFFERAWNLDLKRSRLFYFILFYSFLMDIVFLYALKNLTNGLILAAFILSGVLYQLHHWETPKPSYKDLIHDLKDGMIALKKEIVTVPLKQEAPTSPHSVQQKKRSGKTKE